MPRFLADYVRIRNKRPSPAGCHLVADREAHSVNAVLHSLGYWTKSTETPVKLHEDLTHVVNVRDLEELKSFLENSPGRELLKDGFKRYETKSGKSLFPYKNRVYEIGTVQNDEEVRLLILEEFDLERNRFERLKRKFESGASREIKLQREAISEEVRIAVWRRDEGRS